MEHTITHYFTLDEKNPKFMPKQCWNIITAKEIVSSLQLAFETHGIIYYKEIYDACGIEWDTSKENKYFLRGKDDFRALISYGPEVIFGVYNPYVDVYIEW